MTALQTTEAPPYFRRGAPIRLFSAAEDDLMTRLRIDGASLGEIAAAMGRSRSSVQMRLQALAVRDEEIEGFSNADAI